MAAAAGTALSGCAGAGGLTPTHTGQSTLVAPVFVPGPSEDRFASDAGAVIRQRGAPDGGGVWTSTTRGPGEDSVLTLGHTADGSVLLISLVSGDRDVVCEPPLVIEPGARSLPHTAETACTVDGRPGTARALLEPAPDLGDGWVRLTLEFSAGPVTARRRFDWRLAGADGIAEERAELRVTVFGVPVRSWSRSMTIETD